MYKWPLGSCGVLICHGSRIWAVIRGDPALHFAVGCGSSPTWCWTPGESHDFSKELCALSMAQGAIHCSDLQYRNGACWLHGIFFPLSNILLQCAKWNPMLACAFQRDGWSCLLWRDSGRGPYSKKSKNTGYMCPALMMKWAIYEKAPTGQQCVTRVHMYAVFLVVTLINTLPPTCRYKTAALWGLSHWQQRARGPALLSVLVISEELPMANVNVKIADDCLFHLSVTRHRVVIPIRVFASSPPWSPLGFPLPYNYLNTFY